MSNLHNCKRKCLHFWGYIYKQDPQSLESGIAQFSEAMASWKSDSLDVHSVISVVELVKEPIISVPQEYVHMDQQNPTFTDHPLPTLPTIDFNLLVSVDTTDLELEKLHSSCKEWGFFQVLTFRAIFYVSFSFYR